MKGRSLGVIVYPDGSQAEIIEYETGAPIWESWTEIKPIKRARRLTFAPFHLLVGLSLLLVGCATVPLRELGDKPYCLYVYKEHVKVCEYDSMKACRDNLFDGMVICAPR